ncbi:MAG: dihydroxy-acid dehydratase, partial [Thermoproteaceae archaeon]|nr:dihydroxy-acid dehydratase [Thermoproteaceae archaeon]
MRGGARAGIRVRSPAWYDGFENAPHRAYLRAIGLTDGDLSKPIVGVLAAWSELGPCCYHTLELARHVKEGIKEAGGVGLAAPTIVVN